MLTEYEIEPLIKTSCHISPQYFLCLTAWCGYARSMNISLDVIKSHAISKLKHFPKLNQQIPFTGIPCHFASRLDNFLHSPKMTFPFLRGIFIKENRCLSQLMNCVFKSLLLMFYCCGGLHECGAIVRGIVIDILSADSFGLAE